MPQPPILRHVDSGSRAAVAAAGSAAEVALFEADRLIDADGAPVGEVDLLAESCGRNAHEDKAKFFGREPPVGRWAAADDASFVRFARQLVKRRRSSMQTSPASCSQTNPEFIEPISFTSTRAAEYCFASEGISPYHYESERYSREGGLRPCYACDRLVLDLTRRDVPKRRDPWTT